MSGKIDTYGCPEFFADASSIEVVGGNVRISFGIARSEGRIQGVFSLVMPIEAALMCSSICNQITQSAFNAMQMIDARKRAAH